MGTQESQVPTDKDATPRAETPVKPPGEDLKTRAVEAVEGGARRSLRVMKRWAIEHKGEIFWAAVFAVVVAWLIDPPKPHPYTIYVVAHPRTEQKTMAVFENIENLSQTDGLSVGDVPVQVRVERIDEPTTEAAIGKANDLAKRADTLLVILHLPSQLVEDSLPSYFQSDPPVPVLTTTASDEDLLVKCHQSGVKCFDDLALAPLLQLSPTNKEQGRAAIRFAAQHKLRRFLIVSDKEPGNETYANDLSQAYHDAIDEFNEGAPAGDRAAIVGNYRLDQVVNQAGPKKLNPDCVLYAGELEQAHGLLQIFPGPEPMVILSDSTLDSQLSDNSLKDFTPVRFTFQTDASDYNNHTNVYGKDAYYIARQLIGDLNQRGGDLRYWLKSVLHLHSAKDARRNLVRTMQENSMSRTWYQGAADPQGESDSIYVFRRHKRLKAIFHVWQLRRSGAMPGVMPGSPMEDIDNWHPPKKIVCGSETSALSAEK